MYDAEKYAQDPALDVWDAVDNVHYKKDYNSLSAYAKQLFSLLHELEGQYIINAGKLHCRDNDGNTIWAPIDAHPDNANMLKYSAKMEGQYGESFVKYFSTAYRKDQAKDLYWNARVLFIRSCLHNNVQYFETSAKNAVKAFFYISGLVDPFALTLAYIETKWCDKPYPAQQLLAEARHEDPEAFRAAWRMLKTPPADGARTKKSSKGIDSDGMIAALRGQTRAEVVEARKRFEEENDSGPQNGKPPEQRAGT